MKFQLVIIAVILSSALCLDTLTTNAGAPIDNYKNSQSAGQRGPILLQDYQLIERLQQHNRERIPERNVHARGATAKGYFVSTNDVSNYTFASFLQQGKNTSIACRWSSVIHSVGSPEYLRDPRGFAIKFYTEEGNYDIVGLNFPVFFIRDGIRFPDMIRSLKPNPLTGVQEWWRIYDYFSNYPESVHMFTWLMDDVGIPASYRELDGWGVHTFKWINKQGKETFVRYYYESQQGVKSLDDDEAVTKHFSFHTTDLYDNIEQGNYPKWTVYVQMIPADNVDFINSLNFDILDTTKQWPVDQIPQVKIGEIVFNQNVNSQYLENEQIAFSPARLVPGIEPSDEKMLQTRMFAYADTQTYRLGINNQLLPINRPRCPYFDQHIDGSMNFLEGSQSPSGREINYFPSTMNKNNVQEHQPFYHEEQEVIDGKKVRQQINKTNDFIQATQRYNSWDSDRQIRFARRVGLSLSDAKIAPEVLSVWLGFWTQVNTTLADNISHYINQSYSIKKIKQNLNKKVSYLTHKDEQILKYLDNFEKASGSKIY